LFWSLLISGVLGYVVSLLTAPPSDATLSLLFDRQPGIAAPPATPTSPTSQ